MLSIQYVYELSFLICLLVFHKRLQRYNFYFNLQIFFEKFFILIFRFENQPVAELLGLQR